MIFVKNLIVLQRQASFVKAIHKTSEKSFSITTRRKASLP
jgi:hypothetical protein